MYIFSIKELLFYLSELNTVFSVVDPLAVTLGKKIKSLIWYVAFYLLGQYDFMYTVQYINLIIWRLKIVIHGTMEYL